MTNNPDGTEAAGSPGGTGTPAGREGQPTPMQAALARDADALATAVADRLAEREDRPGQSHFRDAIIARDGGRCAISRYRLAAVLEPACIVPFTQTEALREDPGNGLLLRADLHRLFACYLLSVDPASLAVVVSRRLSETPYARFAGQRLRSGCDRAALAHHHGAFLAAEAD